MEVLVLEAMVAMRVMMMVTNGDHCDDFNSSNNNKTA